MVYKDYFSKPIAISKAINIVLPMPKLMVKLTALKQKQSQLLVNNTNKQTKKNQIAFDFYYVFSVFEM